MKTTFINYTCEEPLTARGIRLCNPGNIRKGDNWVGMAEDQPDPSFVTFRDPVYGIRAMAKLLIAYQTKHGLDTVEKVIDRWAPSNENDTAAYVDHVAQQMSVKPDQKIMVKSPSVLVQLIKAIITHENGQCPYPIPVIEDGVTRATAFA